MATKRSTKPFSRNPKNKAHVQASTSSQKKAVITFQQKESQQVKVNRLRPKVKVVRAVAPLVESQPKQPVQLVVAAVSAPGLPMDPLAEQANKLALTHQLLEITQALKALKIAEREKCAKRIYDAETKAIAQRAAVYLKAQKAGKFPVSWTYPKPEVQPPFEFKG